jgi:protein ImuB
MPMLPIDLLRRRDRADGAVRPARAEHVLVAQTVGQRRVVAACCERSRDAGVHLGLPVAQARAVLPAGTVRLEEATPGSDASRLRALAVWARRFSPLVQVDGTDGLWLDITGCAHLFGDEASMCRAVREELAKLGISTRLAIADTHGCAWALARFGEAEITIVPPGGQRQAMAPLPVEALGVDSKTIRALDELAIDRVAHLLDIPRGVLPARFGRDLLLALDRALGHAMEPLDPVRPITPCKAERIFDGYTTNLEAIELAVREVLGEACAQLESRGRGARQLVVELGRYELESLRLAVATSVPSRDPKHLWTLVRPRLERAHLGFGVERVAVTATRDALMPGSQAEQWEDRRRSSMAAAGELVDVLTGRLGVNAVRGAVLTQSHLPERAFDWTAPLAAPVHDVRPPGTRPTSLFEPPMETTAMALTPDGPVHRIRWQGEDRVVVSCVGPERLGHEWWRGRGSTRDYFRVRCEDGACLWVARARETGRWYVHGVWA